MPQDAATHDAPRSSSRLFAVLRLILYPVCACLFSTFLFASVASSSLRVVPRWRPLPARCESMMNDGLNEKASESARRHAAACEHVLYVSSI